MREGEDGRNWGNRGTKKRCRIGGNKWEKEGRE